MTRGLYSLSHIFILSSSLSLSFKLRTDKTILEYTYEFHICLYVCALCICFPISSK